MLTDASSLQSRSEVTVAPSHLNYLDAARGIAACMVMLFHFTTWKHKTLPVVLWSGLVINGRDAVSFFFVLSGLVLSYKYLQLGKPLDFRSFYFNRFLRLFPAFFITVLANFLYTHRMDLSLTALVDLFLRNSDAFWQEGLLIRDHHVHFPIGWTMNMELCASLLLPFAMVLFRTDKRLIYWLLFFCVLTGSSVVHITFVHFLLGLLLAANFSTLGSATFHESKVYRYRYLIVIIAVLLYSLRQIHYIRPFSETFIQIQSYLVYNFYFLSGIGSAVLLAWIISSHRLQALLSGSALRFFGSISYGIYLMHWIVGRIIFDHWEDFWMPAISDRYIRLGAVFALGVSATLVLATLQFYLIERPVIKWGKRVSSRWHAKGLA